jgi:hypothetical protein
VIANDAGSHAQILRACGDLGMVTVS